MKVVYKLVQMGTEMAIPMVKQEHVKIIAKELEKLGSKIPKEMEEDLKDKDKDKDYLLAKVLYLACGGGGYRLTIEEIASIGNSEFSICKDAIKELCERSINRL